MVRKLQLPVSEEFVTLLQKKWVERYPKSPFYLGDYESISGGFRKNSSTVLHHDRRLSGAR